MQTCTCTVSIRIMEEDKQSSGQVTAVSVSKEKKRLPKILRIHFLSKRTKIITLGVAVGILVLANVLLVVRYLSEQKLPPVNEQEVAYNQAKETVQNSYLSTLGDQDVRVEYIALVNSGDADGALALFENKASTAESDAVRANVYKQLYSTAIVAKQYDHAVIGALGNAKIQPSIEEYEMVVKAYEYTNNKDGQIEYLRKVYELIDPSLEGLSEMRQYTIDRLQALGVQL